MNIETQCDVNVIQNFNIELGFNVDFNLGIFSNIVNIFK